MATCKVPVNIEEVISEDISSGIISEINTLSNVQATGLLASMVKQKDQESGVVSAKGVGRFGDSKTNLEDIGIIKAGLNTSDDPDDLETVLSDPSVFTGKNDVNKVEDILINEALQSQLIQEIITKTLNKLTQQGLIKGDESSADIAAIASLVTDFSFNDIKGFI
mgnify:CR=1 FL=1